MAKKVNFAMVNKDVVARTQTTSDAIFAHAMEQIKLGKAKKACNTVVEKALKEQFDGEIAKLRDAIRREEYKDAEVIEALRELGRIEYKRIALNKWYKDTIASATEYFRLDEIIAELGANNLENGVTAVDKILTDIYGLDKVAVATRKKFARRVYSAMDGKAKASATMGTKGILLKDRSIRDIKEVGLRAMCEYVAHTANITLKTKEDYDSEMKYDKELTAILGYEIKNI